MRRTDPAVSRAFHKPERAECGYPCLGLLLDSLADLWPSGFGLLSIPRSPNLRWPPLGWCPWLCLILSQTLGLCSIPPSRVLAGTSLSNPTPPQSGSLSVNEVGLGWLPGVLGGGGGSSGCRFLSMGSTGRLAGMSQDKILVTAALAGILEVTL